MDRNEVRSLQAESWDEHRCRRDTNVCPCSRNSDWSGTDSVHSAERHLRIFCSFLLRGLPNPDSKPPSYLYCNLLYDKEEAS